MTYEHIGIRVLPDGRVDRPNAAKFLGYSSGTLRNWASRGIGPTVRKVGGKAFYRLADLEAFRDTGARNACPASTGDASEARQEHRYTPDDDLILHFMQDRKACQMVITNDSIGKAIEAAFWMAFHRRGTPHRICRRSGDEVISSDELNTEMEIYSLDIATPDASDPRSDRLIFFCPPSTTAGLAMP